MDDGVECVFPGSRVHTRIASGLVGAGDLEVDGRLTEGLIPGADDLFGRISLTPGEAHTSAGQRIDVQ